jgi:hypothetical protein
MNIISSHPHHGRTRRNIRLLMRQLMSCNLLLAGTFFVVPLWWMVTMTTTVEQ